MCLLLYLLGTALSNDRGLYVMGLKREFENTGNWLFKWRSYLPLVLFGFLLIGIKDYEYFGKNHLYDQLWELSCLALSFFGLAIRAYTIGQVPKGTSGRNTYAQVAEELNTTGIYSAVRHPLYVGNFFCWLGIAMFVHSVWIGIICILAFWLYYERIMFAEEEFLRRKFGKSFEQWASKTPAFIPNVKNWTPANLPFSWRNVLKREYSGFFAIIASFTLLEVLGDVVVSGKIEFDLTWAIIFLLGLTTYLVLRTLKKKTSILVVEGR